MVRLGKYFTIMLMIYGDYRRYHHSTVSKGLDRLYKVLETLEKGIKLHMIPINSQIT